MGDATASAHTDVRAIRFDGLNKALLEYFKIKY